LTEKKAHLCKDEHHPSPAAPKSKTSLQCDCQTREYGADENLLIHRLALLYLPAKLSFMPARLRAVSSSAYLTAVETATVLEMFTGVSLDCH